MKLWAGQTVSELGSVVTRTAVPLVALLVLGAGPLEMALLVVSASLAVLLVGLFAGAWVDRLRRRPLLIGADTIPDLFATMANVTGDLVAATIVAHRGASPSPARIAGSDDPDIADAAPMAASSQDA